MQKLTIFTLGVLLTLFFQYSCRQKNRKQIYVDNYKVVGDISSDSVYNGDIKFYDSATDLLSEEAEYKNGLLNGKRTNYYRNGKVFSILNYEYGKNVGYNRYYDSFGSLESKDYFYYDFKVGPSISYVSGEPKIYDFYAFDNNLIYSLDYDSLKGNIITNLEKDFFHIISYDSVEYFDGNKSSVGLKFLIYQLNPPKYDFNYDVVLIDSAYNVIRVVNKLNSNFPFCFFGVPNLKEGKYFYALRLEVFDSLNAKSNYLMFKKLR